MPLPRSAPLRSLSRTRPTRAIPRSQQWQRTSQRGYADAKESAKEKAQGAADQMKGLRGDATWIIGATVVTIPAAYFVANSGPMTNPFKHPLPGENYHGEHGEHGEHDDDEEHEEGEEGESEGGNEGGEGEESGESGAEKEEGKEKSEGGDEKDDNEEKAEDGSDDKEGGSDEPNNSTEPPADNDTPNADGDQKRTFQPGKTIPGASDSQEPKELEKGKDGQTRLLLPTAKGGNKKRVESSKGIVQGRSEDNAAGETSEDGSIGDVKDGSKSAAAGQTSKQQKGISNTDTKHSTDQMKNPDASKKPEGVPETAKIQGTVDPSRPAK